MRRQRIIILLAALFTVMSVVPAGASDNETISDDDRLLIWRADDDAPDQTLTQGGAIVYMMGTGEISQTLFDVPRQATKVTACTEHASTSGGDAFAFYVGGYRARSSGTLHVLNGRGDPVSFPEVSHRTCLGMGTFRWLPSLDRVAYINFQSFDALPVGTLVFRDMDDLKDTTLSEDDVVAFDVRDDQLAYVKRFDDQVEVFAGGLGAQERVIRLYTDEPDCPYDATHLRFLNGDRLALLLGHGCAAEGNTWNLHLIDISDRVANRVLRQRTPSNVGFSIQSATLNLFPEQGGDSLYLSYPLATFGNYDTRLTRMNLSDIPTETQPEVEGVVMPRQPRDREISTPVYSPDGRWLALVAQTANRNTTLHVIDLTGEHERLTREIDDGTRYTRLSGLSFGPDGEMLYYVVDPDVRRDGEDNEVRRWALPDGIPEILVRGEFQAPLLVSPDGDDLLLNQWETLDDDARYLNLIAIDATSGDVTVVSENAEVEAGEIISQQFTYPLSWRP